MDLKVQLDGTSVRLASARNWAALHCVRFIAAGLVLGLLLLVLAAPTGAWRGARLGLAWQAALMPGQTSLPSGAAAPASLTRR